MKNCDKIMEQKENIDNKNRKISKIKKVYIPFVLLM